MIFFGEGNYKIPRGAENIRSNQVLAFETITRLQETLQSTGRDVSPVRVTFLGKPDSFSGASSALAWRGGDSDLGAINFTPNSLLKNPEYIRSSNSYVFNTGVISTAVHEYGHNLHSTLFKYDSNIIKTEGRQAVSTYGNKNDKEAFAEAFTFYVMGATPTRGKEYYDDFKKLMSAKGLTAFKGLYSSQ